MPVVVTGADTPLGRAVVDRLVADGAEVRATVSSRDAVADLVARGVRTAVSDLYDTERFGAVLEDAHTVVHLRGGLDALRTVADVVAAAEDGTVRRIVTVTRGDPASVLDGTPYDTVVVRVPRFRRVDPVRVVDAVVEADRVRDLTGHHVVRLRRV